MTMKILAVLFLSLAVSACESNSAETNANTNKANANAQASPSTAPSPAAETATAASAPVKAGDKVKIAVNGLATEATVISVDEKLGKVTVRVQGESKERTVAIADVSRQ